MKTTTNICRLAIAIVCLLSMSQIAHAQWGRTAPNVYLTTGTDKVGIGTTTPETKLHINDQTAVSSFTGINNAGLRIHSFDNPLNNYALLGFSGLSRAYNRNLAQIGANFTRSGSSLFFGTSNSYGSGITNTAMTINPHGNVGIGTTTPALKLDVNGDAVFNGVRVGRGNGGMSNNTAIGNGALNSNTTGNGNTATGYFALYSNTTGNYNTATGRSALYSNTTGIWNTANGYQALYSNTTGNYNVATGGGALYFNTTGYQNTANGYLALYSNTSGYNNTANGFNALYSNTTGFFNTASGYQALYSNTTGSGNTANGYGSLFSNTTGNQNTANGFNALYFNTTGLSNTAYGSGALTSNTTGFENTATGYLALNLNTTGVQNTAYGNQALFLNTGSYNTANGFFALGVNTTGGGNTANGFEALVSNTTGVYSTANGYRSLNSNTEGLQNTANGAFALYSNTTGFNNTASGLNSLLSNTTGSSNTAIGFNSDVSSGNLVNATAIGASAIVNSSYQMQLGSSTTIVSTSGGYTIVSDGRFKDEVKTDDAPGLAFINKLRPVAYNFNYKRYDDFLRKDMKGNKTTDEYQQQLVEKGKQRQVGFIAQEVDQMCRDNKFTFNGVYAPQNSNDNYALDYSRFVVPLVKAVQELSSENDKLERGDQSIESNRLRR